MLLKNERLKRIGAKASTLAMMLSTAVMTTNVYADPSGGGAIVDPGIDASGLKTGFIKLIGHAGQWGGFFYMLGGVFAFVLALRNEDTEGRNKAIMNIIAAVLLLSFGTILTSYFNIS